MKIPIILFNLIEMMKIINLSHFIQLFLNSTLVYFEETCYNENTYARIFLSFLFFI